MVTRKTAFNPVNRSGIDSYNFAIIDCHRTVNRIGFHFFRPLAALEPKSSEFAPQAHFDSHLRRDRSSARRSVEAILRSITPKVPPQERPDSGSRSLQWE